MCWKKPDSNVTKITVKDKNSITTTKTNILNSCWENQKKIGKIMILYGTKNLIHLKIK